MRPNIFDRTLYRSRADAGEALQEYLAADVLSVHDRPRVREQSKGYAIELEAA
jgi:hypothetical protein